MSADHYLRYGAIGSFVCRSPMVLGHEASGEVVRVGSKVKSLSPGDRVAIEPGVACASCTACSTGRYNLCPAMRFAATPPVDGSLAHYISHPVRFCFRIPDALSFDTAALLEPLSVGLHATRRAGVALDSTVLITGAGAVGLCCLLAARAAGASRVVVVDIDAGRLEIAAGMGAETKVAARDTDAQDIGAELQVDACIECSGSEAAMRLCLFAARPGGIAVMVGMGPAEVKLPVLDACCREVDIRGVFRYCNTYPAAIGLAVKEADALAKLVTHRFKLEDAVEAFKAFGNRKVKSLKIIIDCSS